MPPYAWIIAGPNGAGKTTFARAYFALKQPDIHFLNVDLLATGLEPLRPASAATEAGRLLLNRLDRIVDCRASFALESTLSGTGYLERIRGWKALGYRVEIFYLWISSVELALRRVARRVEEGGHDVPEPDLRRRFPRSWERFWNAYRAESDAWHLVEADGLPLIPVATGAGDRVMDVLDPERFAAIVPPGVAAAEEEVRPYAARGGADPVLSEAFDSIAWALIEKSHRTGHPVVVAR